MLPPSNQYETLVSHPIGPIARLEVWSPGLENFDYKLVLIGKDGKTVTELLVKDSRNGRLGNVLMAFDVAVDVAESI